jgi:hypothetical protein
MISDTCPAISMFPEAIKSNNLKSGVTDSAKSAHILEVWGLPTYCGTTAQVIEAAVTGKWEG